MGSIDADYSIFVSDVMDVLGYSPEMMRQRRQTPGMVDGFILAGSTGEGTTSIFENDIDVMGVFDDNVICTDNISRYAENPNVKLYELNLRDASPGYTLLKPSRDVGLHVLDEFLEETEKSKFYLQSSNILRCARHIMQIVFPQYKLDFTVLPVTGPSIPGLLQSVSYDIVLSFKCECSAILQEYLARPRKYNQPSKETLNTISNLNSYVVPVGNMSSHQRHIEWRICYTEAEIYLISQLNETQIKLYILMKLLVKSVLADSKDISSYILKNLVFWLCELIPCKHFKKELLVERLVDALRILRLCVKNRYLPNYMIPQRNLLSKLKRPGQVRVLKHLSNMIDEGGNVLFLCPKIKEAMIVMYQSPVKAICCGNLRDTVEQWFMYTKSCDEDRLVYADDEVGRLIQILCKESFKQFQAKLIDRDSLVVNVIEKLKQLFV